MHIVHNRKSKSWYYYHSTNCMRFGGSSSGGDRLFLSLYTRFLMVLSIKERGKSSLVKFCLIRWISLSKRFHVEQGLYALRCLCSALTPSRRTRNISLPCSNGTLNPLIMQQKSSSHCITSLRKLDQSIVQIIRKN